MLSTKNERLQTARSFESSMFCLHGDRQNEVLRFGCFFFNNGFHSFIHISIHFVTLFFFPIATLSIFSGFNSFNGCLSYSCFLCQRFASETFHAALKVPSLLNVTQV